MELIHTKTLRVQGSGSRDVGIQTMFLFFYIHVPLLISSLYLMSYFLRSKTAAHTDSRIRIMNEVVSGIRIIKMYAWEKPFAALVSEVRR